MGKKWLFILVGIIAFGSLISFLKFSGKGRERITAERSTEPAEIEPLPTESGKKTSPPPEDVVQGLKGLKKEIEEVMKRAKKQEEITEKLSKMRIIGLAMMMYVQDWDGYPPREKFSELLMPYIKMEEIKEVFSDPNFRYSPPPPIEKLKNPAETIAVEWKIFPDTTLILYADGHVKRKP